ncbi:cytochrome c oxidase subunit 3 [Actinomycetospora sp. TBRC 11914]|uniref:cytochrome c oxidase subunit 3 n=1 Tax=Actinomycetospora sp. TBRC 11914 TaxID=2729387 RepID=UPI00145D7C67|nr:cytochrome c oxidase subunit 3 [Actinomycetospora sp. TBRC 11914]NMO91579.1 cytochrome c oxidase subunit 3 family protein [Actinomycetospora sp. TBRC 11914]
MSTVTASPVRELVSSRGRIPGEVGIWVFLLIDFLFFGAIFGVFMVERASDPVTFAHSSRELAVGWGALNTLVLLTSSMSMAYALRFIRSGALRAARRMLLVTGLMGAWFVVDKAFEWTSVLRAGHVPVENQFFYLYFTVTGVHLMHVLIGLVVLGYLYLATGRELGRRAAPSRLLRRNSESGAAYWHFVDLLWLVLFAILYLVV